MKGGIACSVAAVLDYLASHGGKPREDGKGSISFLITGDEEDISINGTVKLLPWVAARGETFDHCVLGEPAMSRSSGIASRSAAAARNRARFMSMAKQGHVAYPQRAVESGAGHRKPDRGAEHRAARSRQRPVPGVEPRIHVRRCRQYRQQRDPRTGTREIQHPLQRPPHPGDFAGTGRCASGEGRRQPHPRPDRMGAVEFECVRDKARRLHRPRGRGDRRGHRPQARIEAPAAAPRTRALSRAIVR